MPLKLIPTTPKKSLNAAFLKVRPLRSEIDSFKANLINLLDKIDEAEREENQKTHVRDFLVNTYYKGKNEINTKGTIDLVIHTDSTNKSSVGVIIEAKRPSNKSEWISADKPNGKALQELVLYYLRERIDENNIDIKNIVLTNIYEWYIIDAAYFDKVFYQNKRLVKDYQAWRAGQKVTSDTSLFYTDIVKPMIESIDDEIPCTYFDIRNYEKALRNTDLTDDKKLIELQKLLSEFHLLKVPFANDSNKLDKRFYSELLHIIGLTEIKEGSKKLIGRHKEGDRMIGSILEDTILQLDSRDKLNRVKNASQYGNNKDEKLFNIALELTITWVNRILFLKLLEGQLISYHKGDKGYLFLNHQKIREFDQLDALFFQVLAKRFDERNAHVSTRFDHVPYLNSSLFEPTELEHDTLFISNLSDDKSIPIHGQTVLKAQNGSKRTGELSTLEYLFAFLDAYDFSGEGSEDIQEDNKPLINASVLGLIFEKVNGYKDGSIFTPGFITMYMSRETIRRAVVQKFNEVKGWNCKTFEELKEDIQEEIKSGNRKDVRKEANRIINSLKIIDPAVGSGHFLVSVLNELIAIKSELKILVDDNYEPLSSYSAFVLNDELILTDEEGGLFSYHPKNKESQRVQETLFHEKQTIIENCLFGVDINPNSVKICRLRLWIELLKNAYYKNQTELETLPNIDINIKCGNSLVSRFAIDADIKDVLKNAKQWNIESYKMAVDGYRNAKSKDEKRELESLIEKIKGDFKSEVDKPFKKKISDARGKAEKYAIDITNLTAFGQKIDKKLLKDHEDAVALLTKLESEREDIISNKIYENAFEWRFEFPEVLSDEGDFVGFDVVIGNPPYIGIEDITWDYRRFYETIYITATGRFDLYSLFIEKAMQIKKPTSVFTYIIPGKFLNNKQFVTARKLVCTNHGVTVVKIDDKVFEDAQVDSVIVENYPMTKAKYKSFKITMQELQSLSETEVSSILNDKEIIFRLEINTKFNNLISKIEEATHKVKEIAEVKDGIVAGAIKDLLFIDNKVDDESHKLYFGKNISRFHLSKTDVWINYNPEEMMKHEIERQAGKRSGLWMRDKKIFERDKIIYRKVGKELIATYAEKGIFYEQTIHSCHITDKRFKTKYVLGLFNSSLFKFYYRKTNSQGGDIFPQVRISSVENLPIKLADINTQEKVETLVDQILTIKSQEPSANTIDIETQIDQLVYELYGLTEDEIRIVEGK